jgi:hypothetical protein
VVQCRAAAHIFSIGNTSVTIGECHSRY